MIELFPAFWQFLFGWIVKTACYLSVVKVWEIFVELDQLYNQMRTMSLKFSDFGRNFSDKIVKPAFYVSIGTFRRKYFLEFIKTFPNMERKFRLFVIFFSGFVKTIIYRSRGTVRWKKLFQKGTFFWSFRENERKISGRLAICFRLSCQNC